MLEDLPSRVLVVDDEPANRKLLRVLLGRHEVIEASSAEEAYAIAADAAVDLVLLDVLLPGDDGITACPRLKALAARDGGYVPVILLTALEAREDRHRGFEAGADDFISKPFDRRELQLRVGAFLRIRHQQETIRRQVQELRVLDRLKDDLASLIVHDLRNPLAGLDGVLEVMSTVPEANDQQELLGWARIAARNVRDTVEDMLKVRLMEESRLQLAIAHMSLRRIAHAAADSLRGDAELRHLSLSVEGDDVELDADERLLRRAVENLVSNGLRYTRTGTGVTIAISAVPGAVRIEVSDRGPGIPDAAKGSLFDKYASVEVWGGEPRRGNGLGLYLVRLTVEAHGGELAVLDRAGGGTTFRIELPQG